MLRSVYDRAVLVDTSAVVAIFGKHDDLHELAVATLRDLRSSVELHALNLTAFESFTRLRYDYGPRPALAAYTFLRSAHVRSLTFDADDERVTVDLLSKYSDQKLSYHDALSAAVMRRHGIYKIFAFDADFWTFGHEVMPGQTR